MKVILESKPLITFDSILSTSYCQSITNVTKVSEKVTPISELIQILLASSDIGHLYVIENGENYIENNDHLENSEEKLSEKRNKKKNSSKNAKKSKRTLFTPY